MRNGAVRGIVSDTSHDRIEAILTVGAIDRGQTILLFFCAFSHLSWAALRLLLAQALGPL